MSKSLPVYDLSQWIKSDRNIGYVVAKMSAASVWEVREDYANRKDVERFNGRGAGYVVQWVDLRVDVGDGPCIDVPHPDEIGVGDCLNRIAGSVPRRLSWLRDETIAEKRYQPCENPVKSPATIENPLSDPEPSVHWACPPDDATEASFASVPSQPALPLDIEAATEATMRAAVALGNQAADWLRAKGLTL